MIRSRAPKSLFLAAALLAGASGCGDPDDAGGNGGGIDADFVEEEPNDTQAGADALGGAVTFGGLCAPEEDDWFSLDVAGPGTLSVSLEWIEGPEENDLDLAIYDSSGDVVVEDVAAAPSDSPAGVELAVSSASTFAILVDCYLVYGDVEYLGTITRP